MKIRMSDGKRGTSRKIRTEGDADVGCRRYRAQHLLQPCRHESADEHDIGRRWRRRDAAEVAMFAGVPGDWTRRLLAGLGARAGIVQADDGERVDAVLSRSKSRADTGQ